MRRIGVVSVGRSDFGILRPLLGKIVAHPAMELRLYVTGAHLSPEFGLTVREIEDEGFPIAERIEITLSSETPEGVSKAMGLGLIGFAQVFTRETPDLLVIMGDRYEMVAATLAAAPFNIPIAHLHGGELSEGAIDEVFRHAITKMSHLHFASTERYARRIVGLGEQPDRVVHCGALSLDNLRALELLDRGSLEAALGHGIEEHSILVTYHPETRRYEMAERDFDEVLAALEASSLPVVFTYPNADPGGRRLIAMIDDYVARHVNAWVHENLGTKRYFSLMREASMMLGNSSSGIIEAASFSLPVVNVGDRQRGRVHGENVIDVTVDRRAILAGIHQAMDERFRQRAAVLANPYGDGRAAEVIISRIESADLSAAFVCKAFYDEEVDS